MVRLKLLTLFTIFTLVTPFLAVAQQVATTTLTLSICGNSLVDNGEQCDIPGETGVYSQTIVGRQCSAQCRFGPYCGDGILQSPFGEECDDGNNTDRDFCSAICKVEPAGSGGGGSSGGGSGGGGGGSSRQQGDTVVNITGRAYPSRTINFLLDGDAIGTVQSNGQGLFEFSTKSSPGTATLGMWATDVFGTKSITMSNTFDVTQGAVTNLNDLVLPPSIKVSQTNFTPGTVLTVSGQSVPNATIDLYIDRNLTTAVATGQSGGNGQWSIQYNTSRLSATTHTLRARSVTGAPPLEVQSGMSSTIELTSGSGTASPGASGSDLNSDTKVNLIDFSILIFWWNTEGGTSGADINGNGRVSLEDFSILLFNWTG